MFGGGRSQGIGRIIRPGPGRPGSSGASLRRVKELQHSLTGRKQRSRPVGDHTVSLFISRWIMNRAISWGAHRALSGIRNRPVRKPPDYRGSPAPKPAPAKRKRWRTDPRGLFLKRVRASSQANGCLGCGVRPLLKAPPPPERERRQHRGRAAAGPFGGEKDNPGRDQILRRKSSSTGGRQASKCRRRYNLFKDSSLSGEKPLAALLWKERSATPMSP